MNKARRRTKQLLADIRPDAIDWAAPQSVNSIGTLLAHIVAIEMDWLFTEVLEQEIPAAVATLLPPRVRDDAGRLITVVNLGPEVHLQRLDASRAVLLDAYRRMSRDDFRRPRHLPDYDVTPDWVLYHLMQHEAEHRGEIGMIRAQAEHALGPADGDGPASLG